MQRACAISGAVDAVTGVLIQRTFREKDADLVVELFWREASVAQVAINAMEYFGIRITLCAPAAIWYTVTARGTVFTFVEASSNVILRRHLNSVTFDFDAVVSDELTC